MRIKFLSVIIGFLFVSIAVSSCLESDTTIEYSSDATIHAFGLDTIHGRHYQFSIDQLNRLIFNQDSLPVGSDTIIDRILIDTMSVAGWITSGSPLDTIFIMKDSVNLLPAMNNDVGMKFKVHAADGVTVREYTLKVNVHKQDPDSLTWRNMGEEGAPFSSTASKGVQRSVLLNSDLWVYTSNTTAYKTSTGANQYRWSTVSVSNLPSDAQITSIINFKETLYMITASGDLYTSTNGESWNKTNSTNNPIRSLVTTLPENKLDNMATTLVSIQEEGSSKFFYTTTDGVIWFKAQEVAAGFPTENIYAAPLTTANGVDKIVVAGMPQATNEQTIPWFTMDGKIWGSMSTTSSRFCPGMANPAIIYYGSKFYLLGGKMDAIYSSSTGIAWLKTTKKFLLPAAFKDKTSYSLTVDKNNFIWVVFGGNNAPNEVWRGRLNRLGFKQK